jgi:hypothetical protein
MLLLLAGLWVLFAVLCFTAVYSFGYYVGRRELMEQITPIMDDAMELLKNYSAELELKKKEVKKNER